MQEEETTRKILKLTKCCDKLKKIKNGVFVNVKVKYISLLSHENKFTVSLTLRIYLAVIDSSSLPGRIRVNNEIYVIPKF